VIKDTPEYYNNLDKVYSKAWDLLILGASNRNSFFHTPVFICGNNNNYDGRIIVLRGASKEEKKMWHHTDHRSKKIQILKENSKGSFLFYDKNEKIQLRISGKVRINYNNDISKNSWKKTAHMSRQCYLGEKIPGDEIDFPTSGLDENIDNFKYTIDESDSGYKNFCVIETFITSLEWLYLAAKGHRRALFTFSNDSVEKNWIIP